MTQAPGTVSPKLKLSPQSIERCITRLDQRIAELKAFNVAGLVRGNSAELTALRAAIQDTLIRCFGQGTTAISLYSKATALQHVSRLASRGSPVDYATPTRKNIAHAIALLQQGKLALEEDLADHKAEQEAHSIAVSAPAQKLSRRVFVVHGHDEGARETVARYLDQLGFTAVILHEQANKGRTVMEKVEADGDVGFAVVLLTPDDMGCVKGGTPEPRARQNVLLELGYFLGRLGREKVCALKRGALEIPSDFAGVVWQSMEGDGWKLALGRELDAAGYEIDWNKVMRP